MPLLSLSSLSPSICFFVVRCRCRCRPSISSSKIPILLYTKYKIWGGGGKKYVSNKYYIKEKEKGKRKGERERKVFIINEDSMRFCFFCIIVRPTYNSHSIL